jgi:acyl carrier protein
MVASCTWALLDLDAIEKAVVVAREDSADHKRLVAYVVPTSAVAPTTSALRRALAANLPDYMIPSSFVFLDTMPLVGIGKVDRRALPDPGRNRPRLDTPFVAPRTPIENQLARIWLEVLSFDQVGIHDDFFDLGGDSLAAMRVVSKVIKKFQLEIPLQSLFQSPTVAEMAAVITESHGKELGEKDLDRILTELESRSDEEAKRLLADQSETAITKN